NPPPPCPPAGRDPPCPCAQPDQSLPTHLCCAGMGSTPVLPVITPPILLNPCCPGLVPKTASPLGVGCCVDAGNTCASDAECCTTHCTGGTCESCRAAGGACTSPFECCSLSCTAGTCDACAGALHSCLDDANCST